MATFEVDIEGATYEVDAPDESTAWQWANQTHATQKPQPPSLSSAISDKFKSNVQEIGNAAAGAIRGAGSIGSTILAPYDMTKDALAGKGLSLESNRQRRADIDTGLGMLGADTGAKMYQAGKIGAEIAGTAGAGSAIARPVSSMAPRLAESIASGGVRIGQGGNKLANLLLRGAGGAISGGATAGAVNPEEVATGAGIGAAFPVAGTAAATGGRAIGRALTGGPVGDGVKTLARKAADLGIDIPADRLVNSRPINALASSLNYVPLSGRAATEELMQKQMNQALSKTFGQNSDNVTQALRQAGNDLGEKFGATLKGNSLNVDNQFLDDLANLETSASAELGKDGFRAITGQIDEIIKKGAGGSIDGQSAYNIKKTLDRISSRSTPEAFHARELKKSLMSALDRSLGPEEAAKFATVRKQYGNMLSLENLAQNGAEGDISIARIANMKKINNPELQDIADIAAQFLKSREGQHGAAQRVLAGGAVGLTGGLPALAGGMAVGRGVNMALNSDALKKALMSSRPDNKKLAELLRSGAVIANKSAPVISAQ